MTRIFVSLCVGILVSFSGQAMADVSYSGYGAPNPNPVVQPQTQGLATQFLGNTTSQVANTPSGTNFLGAALALAGGQTAVDQKLAQQQTPCYITTTDITFAIKIAKQIVDNYDGRESSLEQMGGSYTYQVVPGQQYNPGAQASAASGSDSMNVYEVFNQRFLQNWNTDQVGQIPDLWSKACANYQEFQADFVGNDGRIDIQPGQYCFELVNTLRCSKSPTASNSNVIDSDVQDRLDNYNCMAKPSYVFGAVPTSPQSMQMLSMLSGGAPQLAPKQGFYSNFYAYVATIADFMPPENLIPKDGVQMQKYIALIPQCAPSALAAQKQAAWLSYIFTSVAPDLGLTNAVPGVGAPQPAGAPAPTAANAPALPGYKF